MLYRMKRKVLFCSAEDKCIAPDPQAAKDAELGRAVRAICFMAHYTPKNLRTLVGEQLLGLASAVADALEQEQQK